MHVITGTSMCPLRKKQGIVVKMTDPVACRHLWEAVWVEVSLAQPSTQTAIESGTVQSLLSLF